MQIRMTRGDLLQLSQSVQRLAPAKRDHAERFRRAADAIVTQAEAVNKEHKAEVKAALDLVPTDSRTQEKIQATQTEKARTNIMVAIEPKDLQVLVAAYVAFWAFPLQNGLELGQPYASLNPFVEDLKALRVWTAWKLDVSLIVEDPELDKAFPVSELEEVPLDDRFPVSDLPPGDPFDDRPLGGFNDGIAEG